MYECTFLIKNNIMYNNLMCDMDTHKYTYTQEIDLNINKNIYKYI